MLRCQPHCRSLCLCVAQRQPRHRTPAHTVAPTGCCPVARLSGWGGMWPQEGCCWPGAWVLPLGPQQCVISVRVALWAQPRRICCRMSPGPLLGTWPVVLIVQPPTRGLPFRVAVVSVWGCVRGSHQSAPTGVLSPAEAPADGANTLGTPTTATWLVAALNVPSCGRRVLASAFRFLTSPQAASLSPFHLCCIAGSGLVCSLHPVLL